MLSSIIFPSMAASRSARFLAISSWMSSSMVRSAGIYAVTRSVCPIMRQAVLGLVVDPGVHQLDRGHVTGRRQHQAYPPGRVRTETTQLGSCWKRSAICCRVASGTSPWNGRGVGTPPGQLLDDVRSGGQKITSFLAALEVLTIEVTRPASFQRPASFFQRLDPDQLLPACFARSTAWSANSSRRSCRVHEGSTVALRLLEGLLPDPIEGAPAPHRVYSSPVGRSSGTTERCFASSSLQDYRRFIRPDKSRWPVEAVVQLPAGGRRPGVGAEVLTSSPDNIVLRNWKSPPELLRCGRAALNCVTSSLGRLRMGVPEARPGYHHPSMMSFAASVLLALPVLEE